jgi:TonB-dependent starch-binding outer membrane protein SusC
MQSSTLYGHLSIEQVRALALPPGSMKAFRSAFRPILVLAATFLLAGGCSQSREATRGEPMRVSGIVVAEQGAEPLEGVEVAVRGARQVVRTDSSGRFEMQAPANGLLLVSRAGFQSEQVPVQGRSQVNIVLVARGDQVNVGYGTQSKRDVTGSVASVNPDSDGQRPVTRVEDLLRGRVAGVQVLDTPGGLAVRIRGTSSIMGGNDPLFVVDGMPLAPGPGGTTGLNPSDVESIEVLKDASATAIYGTRGANGVVLITTKRGQRK